MLRVGTFAEGVVVPCLGASAGYHTEVQAITVCPVWVTCLVAIVERYSRMRSEGFPFIVGVWGWTCVVALVVR